MLASGVFFSFSIFYLFIYFGEGGLFHFQYFFYAFKDRESHLS